MPKFRRLQLEAKDAKDARRREILVAAKKAARKQAGEDETLLRAAIAKAEGEKLAKAEGEKRMLVMAKAVEELKKKVWGRF